MSLEEMAELVYEMIRFIDDVEFGGVSSDRIEEMTSKLYDALDSIYNLEE